MSPLKITIEVHCDLSRDIWTPKIFGPPGPNITEIADHLWNIRTLTSAALQAHFQVQRCWVSIAAMGQTATAFAWIIGGRGSTVNCSIARIVGAVKLTKIVIYDPSAVQYSGIRLIYYYDVQFSCSFWLNLLGAQCAHEYCDNNCTCLELYPHASTL